MNSRRPPNIIFINTDQQRYDTIAALGFPYMNTPNLDRLFNEGVTFSNCFITASSCAPTRASLFSGLYAHNHGVLRNGSRWPHIWVEDLANAGYHCVNIGKMHTMPYEASMGFHERFVVENKERSSDPEHPEWNPQGPVYVDEQDKVFAARGLEKPGKTSYRAIPDFEELQGAYVWPAPEELHSDFFVGDAVIDWIGRNPSLDKPLFLEIGFPGPHPPYDPVERYIDEYMDKDLPIQEATEEERDNQPQALQDLRERMEEVFIDSLSFDSRATPEQRHRQRAYYLANVTMIDEKVGQILDFLRANGYLENAVVIFTSDHGDCLGDHALGQKWNMYDTIVHVPTVIWSSGEFAGGRVVDDLYQWFDLGPTILELAGLDVPTHFEAVSMVPALRDDPDAAGRDYVFCEHARDRIMRTTALEVMIRDRDWKLVYFPDHDDGQLFDLNADPAEEHDLWHDSTHAARKQKLLGEMQRWFMASTIAGAEGAMSAEWASIRDEVN
jgi:arylsulfatase A-like enzyme